MNIAKIQKLNDMAMNLQHHNIGYSKEDAISQAEQLYGKGNSFSREQLTDPNGGELWKDVRKLTFGLQNALGEIRELKAQVKKLEKELNDVRVNPTPKRVVSNQRTHGSSPQKTLAEPKKDINQPIDRNKVAPNEVSIEKYFYFGQK